MEEEEDKVGRDGRRQKRERWKKTKKRKKRRNKEKKSYITNTYLCFFIRTTRLFINALEHSCVCVQKTSNQYNTRSRTIYI